MTGIFKRGWMADVSVGVFALMAVPALANGTSGGGTVGLGVGPAPGATTEAGTGSRTGAGTGTGPFNSAGGDQSTGGMGVKPKPSCTGINSAIPCNQQAGTTDSSTGLPMSGRADSLSATGSMNSTGPMNSNNNRSNPGTSP